MVITCCEIAITLAVTNLFSLAIFAGYTVHLRSRQMILEKKNGAEQHQLDQLRQELAQLKNALPPLPKTPSTN